eukprot:1898270-Pleurochrysis_carterae.AAC.2
MLRPVPPNRTWVEVVKPRGSATEGHSSEAPMHSPSVEVVTANGPRAGIYRPPCLLPGLFIDRYVCVKCMGYNGCPSWCLRDKCLLMTRNYARNRC